MKTRIILPTEAHVALQGIYPFGSQELILKAFCMENDLTDAHLRTTAQTENITITEALRREVVAEHPSVGPAWPEKRKSPKQLAYAKRRTSAVVDTALRSALVRAAVIIQKLLENNQRVRPSARDFVKEWE